MKHLLICLALAALASDVWAQAASPVGLWKNVDDETGKPKALIRISDSGGELQGTIERLFGERKDAQPVCSACEGALKDKPIIGLTIISGMKRDGDRYAGGQILDPGNGKTYRSTIEMVDGGKKLKVRGYIGMPMLGRTQVWLREE